jgi:hypothetical protein
MQLHTNGNINQNHKLCKKILKQNVVHNNEMLET